MSLLTLSNVSRHFGSLVALTDVSMELEEGELRAIIGPNGAGKTTLFNLISGYFPPTSGEVLFAGQSTKGVKPEKLVDSGIVRTFQITEIFLEQTVYQNLRVAVESAMGVGFRPWLGRSMRQKIEAGIDELMATMNLSDKADRIAGELPHGYQRVVEIAMVLAQNPRLLLLDEPTAGMGDEETERMTELIRYLHEDRGTSMLFIEHDMAIVFKVADRITVLDNGHLLAQGTPEQISNNESVQKAYLGGE